MRFMRAFTAALAVGLCAMPALADDYPSRPIRVVIPQGAGGGADIVVRILGTEIQRRIGQPFVVENRPGGNESIGPDAVSKAPPDGYTIGIISSTHSVNQTSAGIKLSFDLQKDFAPIAPMVRVPMIVMVPTDLGVHDLPSLIALSKANPGKFNYGSAGPNTFAGIATEWLVRKSGGDFTAVTYGGRGILQGLVAGDIQLLLGGLAAASPTLQTGKAKIIAVTSAQRAAKLPDVPTVAESYAGFAVVPWYGFVAPAGTPPAIVERLNSAIGASITAVTPKLLELGFEPLRMSPSEFQSFLGADLASWKQIVEAVK
jgi:tripartite-type tricarboxylate transporter receptor subunit TctC